MPLFVKSRSFLRNLFSFRRVEVDLDQEVHSHLEMLIAENIRAGMPVKEAQRAAQIELGGIEQVKEQVREERIGNWFHSVISDCRYGVRQLRKNRGFTAVAVLTLALGIGANCAVFTVLNAALLRPFPFPNYENLMRVFSVNMPSGAAEANVSYLDFKDWQQQSRTIEHMAAYASGGAFLTGDGPAERVGATGVTADFFSVLGARPLVGRGLVANDEKSGAAVISYSLWQRRYGGRSDILSHTLHFNGNAAPVVGVMPSGLTYPEGTDLWTVGVDTESPRSSRGLRVIASRRSDDNLQTSQSEIGTIAARLAEAYPQTNRDWQARVISLRELRARGSKSSTLLALVGAALLLLIACANIGTLQLVRIADRRQEIAVRFALGATRTRLIGQLLVEGLLLSLAGAASGLILMYWGVRFLLRSGMLLLGFAPDIAIDFRVLAFTLVVSLSATLLFILAPLRHALSVRPDLLADGGRTSTSGSHVRRLHSLLVAGQLSLVLVLLTTALLLNRSFQNVLHVDLGFDPKGVLTGGIAYFDDDKRIEFFRRVVDSVRLLPGVNDVATSYSLPLDKDGAFFRPAPISAQRRTSADQQVIASYHIISPGYFRLLRMSLTEGRDFAETDGLHSQPVAIANEDLASRLFPDGRIVGQQIACCEEGKSRTIVGVVRDLKSENPESPASPEIYVPFDQDSQVSTRILVRTSDDPKRLIPEVRSSIASVDSEWPLYDIRTMEQIYDSAIASRRSQLILLGSFALIALALSVVGIYGTFTYVAANRSREFAIRMALGANQKSILQLALRDAGLLVAVGLALGTTLALIAGYVIRGLLFGVTAFDLRLYFEAVALLATTAFTCSVIPGLRATRVDPMIALRYE